MTATACHQTAAGTGWRRRRRGRWRRRGRSGPAPWRWPTAASPAPPAWPSASGAGSTSWSAPARGSARPSRAAGCQGRAGSAASRSGARFAAPALPLGSAPSPDSGPSAPARGCVGFRGAAIGGEAGCGVPPVLPRDGRRRDLRGPPPARHDPFGGRRGRRARRPSVYGALRRRSIVESGFSSELQHRAPRHETVIGSPEGKSLCRRVPPAPRPTGACRPPCGEVPFAA